MLLVPGNEPCTEHITLSDLHNENLSYYNYANSNLPGMKDNCPTAVPMEKLNEKSF